MAGRKKWHRGRREQSRGEEKSGVISVTATPPLTGYRQ